MKTRPPQPILMAFTIASALCLAAPARAQHAAPDAAWAPNAAGMPTSSRTTDLALAQSFDTALQAYERCHWTEAFEQLLGLAERDHGPAARMVLQMHRHGPALFGRAFELSPLQRARLGRMHAPTQATLATRAP